MTGEVRYYLGQAVEVLGPDGRGWWRAEFVDERRRCEPKMDAAREGRACSRGTEGCAAKHRIWRMWGDQLREAPWA